MRRHTWYDDLPTTKLHDVANPDTDLTVQILETKQTQFDEMTIAFNPSLGNILSLGGEVQISQADYDDYHRFVIKSLKLDLFEKTRPHILIIGDGDGGFTKFGDLIDVDIVERDLDVIEAGAHYFGSEWDKVSLRVMSVEDFTPTRQYDGISLAVDAGFNNFALEGQLDRIWSWLKPGGRLVGQASMITDPHFMKTFMTYENWCHKNDIDHTWESVYIYSYFARQNFFVGVKG